MAKKLEDSAKEESDNKELVMQLIEEARSGAFMGACVKIRTRGADGKACEYIGTVAEIDYTNEIIRINEAQAIEGASMREIVKYEWL